MVENDISSIQNPKIKLLTALQKKSAERRSRGVFVVEGQRELQHCVEAGFEVESLFVCKELFTGDFDVKNAAVYTVSPKVYEHIAYRGSTEGVVAVVKCRERSLDDLELGETPLIIVLGGRCEGRCCHRLRPADRPLQPELDSRQHRCCFHRSRCRLRFVGLHRFSEVEKHPNSDGATPRFEPLLRNRHAARHRHRDGNRIDRTDAAVAPRSRRAHPNPDARQARLVECVGFGGNFAV